MQYALNYSGTMFLSTENLLNFLVDSVLIIFHKVDESGLSLDPWWLNSCKPLPPISDHFEPFLVVSPTCLFRPESIFLEKEETSFFRALSLIPCNTEHKEVKVVNLTKTCPTIKELQQSFLKVKELCMLETSKEFWSMDSTWLTSLEASRYVVMNKLLLLSYCWII